MKAEAKITEETKFSPVELNLKFETKDELDYFYAIFNSGTLNFITSRNFASANGARNNIWKALYNNLDIRKQIHRQDKHSHNPTTKLDKAIRDYK